MADSKKIALLVGGGLLGLGGLYLLLSDEDSSNSASSNANSGGSVGSIPQQARALFEQHARATNCSISWLTSSARTGLQSRTAFFRDATAWAQREGASTVDEVTGAIAQAMVPGCPWPPQALEGLDLDDALAGRLSGLGPITHWSAVKGLSQVDFYLALRSVVASMLAV